MQFEDYVVAELSNINAKRPAEDTLGCLGEQICGTGNLNADSTIVKPLAIVF